MEKIPTAEEFRVKQNILPDLSPLLLLDGKGLNGNERINHLMIEFAKLHCEAQIKAIIEGLEQEIACDSESTEHFNLSVKPSIKKAYNLKNIK
jgi:hypothetical protein